MNEKALPFAWLLLLVASCSRSQASQGKWTSCSCPYLTDFDDRATHNVEVCSPSPEKAPALAVQCAERLAHGHVDACTCAAPTTDCVSTDPCKSEEYK